jgi:predicted RNA-binding protein
MRERYYPPEKTHVLLLVPQTLKKPFHKAREFNRIRQVFQRLGEKLSSGVHVCFYAAPFGLIPLELDEVYPLSQHEIVMPLDLETVDYVAGQVAGYIRRTHYETVVLLHDSQHWSDSIKKLCENTCLKNGKEFDYVDVRVKGSKNILTRLEMILRKHLSE